MDQLESSRSSTLSWREHYAMKFTSSLTSPSLPLRGEDSTYFDSSGSIAKEMSFL